jgi:tight adherence protein B
MPGASFWGTDTGLAIAMGLAFLALFALGWLLFGTAARAKHDRRMASRMASAGRNRPNVLPDKSEATWIPPQVTKFGQRFASAGGFGEAVDMRLEAAGLAVRSGEFVVASAATAFAGAVIGYAMLQNPLMALAVAAACGAGPWFALQFALKHRADKLREQLPEVLTIMASSLRAGHSFLQAIDTVSKEIQEPAAAEFVRVVAEIRLGRPVEEALEAMADRVGSADFRWAVLAVNIQREVGGNLAEILDNVADTLRERAQMRRQVLVLTAEGRLSAYVLVALPFGIGLYMTAVNPEYIGLLVTTKLGLVMLVGACVLIVAGILWMRKIVNIDV